MALTANWLQIGKQMGVDFKRIDPREWVRGCDHELEHYNTLDGNPRMIAGIAKDHLDEEPNYYAKLEAMERGDHTQKALRGYDNLVRPLTDGEMEAAAMVTPADMRAILAEQTEPVKKLLGGK